MDDHRHSGTRRMLDDDAISVRSDASSENLARRARSYLVDKPTRKARVTYCSGVLALMGFIAVLIIIAHSAGRQFDPEVNKSESDPKTYRSYVMTNGMRALLVSDPDATKSYASVSVNAGSLLEPENLPGLAHFLEHMLFLGSKTYPEEDAYSSHMAQNGGSTNAYTSMEETNYHFSISPGGFEKGLDIFSHFFIDPLLTASAVSREVHAVDSEFRKDEKDPGWREWMMIKEAMNPAHPLSRFNIGNVETLLDGPKTKGIDIHAELLKFHQKFYKAQAMTLVLQSHHSLDKIEEMATPFELIPSGNITQMTTPFYWDTPLFGEDQHNKVFSYKTLANSRFVWLLFELPASFNNYQTDPLIYLSYILKYPQAGGMIHTLRQKGYITSTEMEIDRMRPATLFGFKFELTEEGFKNIDECLVTFMYYVQKLQREGIPKEIAQDVQKLSELNYKYRETTNILAEVIDIARKLHFYPAQDVLQAGSVVTQFDSQVIADTLVHMSASRLVVLVGSQEYEGDAARILANTDDIPNGEWRHSDFFEIEYKVDNLGAYTVNRIVRTEDQQLYDGLKFVGKNNYIPTDFSYYNNCKETVLAPAPGSKDAKGVSCFDIHHDDKNDPEVIYETEGTKISYALDRHFKSPRVVTKIRFASTFGYKFKSGFAKLLIHQALVLHTLETEGFYPVSAGLRYEIEVQREGFTEVTIDSFGSKFYDSASFVISELRHFTVTKSEFDNVKDTLARELENWSNRMPYSQAIPVLERMILTYADLSPELIKSVQAVTYKQYRNFRTGYFRKLNIEAMVVGNVTHKSAKDLATILDNNLGYDEFGPALVPKQQVSIIDPGISWFRRFQFNEETENDLIMNVYQIDTRDYQTDALAALLKAVIAPEAFERLRTKEQLGYVVFASTIDLSDVLHFFIMIQGDKYRANRMDEAIETFIDDDFFGPIMDSLEDDDTFEKFKKAAIQKYLAPPTGLSARCNLLFHDMTHNHGNYSYREKVREAIEKIKQRQFEDWTQNILRKEVRKLTIQLFSTQGGEIPEEPPVREDTLATKELFRVNLDSFKNKPKWATQ